MGTRGLCCWVGWWRDPAPNPPTGVAEQPLSRPHSMGSVPHYEIGFDFIGCSQLRRSIKRPAASKSTSKVTEMAPFAVDRSGCPTRLLVLSTNRGQGDG